MANLLGHKSWNRSKTCKRVNCCNRPRWSYGSQRLRETRQWESDWFEEEAPECPEWLERYFVYQYARLDSPPCEAHPDGPTPR